MCPPWLPRLWGSKMKYLNENDVERAAYDFRLKIGLHDTKIHDGRTILTKWRRAYPEFHFLVEEDHLMPDEEAFWDDARKLMVIRASTFEAANSGEPRALMTLCHEIGHSVLGHKGKANRATVKTRAEVIAPLVKQQEWQAKRFAAALIAPFHLIGDCKSAAELSFQFRLSAEAGRIRFSELEAYKRRNSNSTRKVPQVVAEVLRDLQSETRTSDEALRYSDSACRKCQSLKLIPVGIKYLCLGCDEVTDI